MSLYTDLIAAGVPVSNRYSDLYAPFNAEVLEILKKYRDQNRSVFTSQIDGKLWLEFPFAYDPYWEKRQ